MTRLLQRNIHNGSWRKNMWSNFYMFIDNEGNLWVIQWSPPWKHHHHLLLHANTIGMFKSRCNPVCNILGDMNSIVVREKNTLGYCVKTKAVSGQHVIILRRSSRQQYKTAISKRISAIWCFAWRVSVLEASSVGAGFGHPHPLLDHYPPPLGSSAGVSAPPVPDVDSASALQVVGPWGKSASVLVYACQFLS